MKDLEFERTLFLCQGLRFTKRLNLVTKYWTKCLACGHPSPDHSYTGQTMLQRPIHAYHELTHAFALAGGSHTISLWKLEDSAISAGCEEIRRPRAGRLPTVQFHLRNDSLKGLFFQDESTLVGVHSSGKVIAWRVDWACGEFAQDPVWTLDLQTTVTAFEVRAAKAGAGWRVAIGGDRGRVFVLDAPSKAGASPVVSLGHAHVEAVISLAFDGDRIASGARDRLIQLWKMPRSALVGAFAAIGDAFRMEDPGVDAATVATQSLTHLQTLEGCQGWPLALSFSHDGTKIAAGCMDNGLYCWKLSAGYFGTASAYLTSFVHDGWVSDIAFSPDDTVLATACWDHSVGVFDTNSLVLRHLFQQHRDYAVKVLFVPDSEFLLSASYDQTIAVWDWKNFRSLDVLVGHRDWVGNLVLLSDGLVASVTSDHSVSIWSTEEWRLLEILGPSLYGDVPGFDEDSLVEFLAAAEKPEVSEVEVQMSDDDLVVDVIGLILDAFSESEESDPMFLTPISTPLWSDGASLIGSTSDVLYSSLKEDAPPEVLTREKFQSIFEALSPAEVYRVDRKHVQNERVLEGVGADRLDFPMLSDQPDLSHIAQVVAKGAAMEDSGLFSLPGFFIADEPSFASTTRLAPGMGSAQKSVRENEVRTRELDAHHLDEDLSVPETDFAEPLGQSSKSQVIEADLLEILGDVAWNAPGMGILKRRAAPVDTDYQPFLQIQTQGRGAVCVGLALQEDKIITGGAGADVCIWHSRGHLEHRFSLPSGESADGVGFLAGGRVAYALGEDHQIHLWLLPRAMLGRPGLAQYCSLHGHRGRLTSAAMHPSERLLLTGSHDTTSRLWCMRSGDCLRVFQGHTGGVTGVTFGARGPVTVGQDGRVNFWDMHGALIDQIDLATPLLGVDSLGGQVSWVAESGAVYTMREGSTRPTSLVGHLGQARSVAFRADGAMVTAGGDGRVFVYEADAKKPGQEILLPVAIQEVRLSERMLTAACEDGTVYLFRRGFQ